MNRISKLLWLELVPAFLVALVALTFIAFSKEFQRFAQILIQSGTSIASFLYTIVLIVPNVLFLTLPMAMVVAIISSLGRLSADNEITAMKSCGVGVLRLTAPVLGFGLLCAGATFVCTTKLAPMANASLRNLQIEIAIAQVTTEISPRTFNEKLKNLVLFAEEMDRRSNTWRGIFICDLKNPGEKRIYLAKSGLLYPAGKNVQLHLENGVAYQADVKKPESDSVTYFGDLDIPMKGVDYSDPSVTPKRNQEKSMAELESDISKISNTVRVLRADPPERKDTNHIEMAERLLVKIELEYHQRYALPFACIVFAILGIPLGIGAPSSGRSSGFLVALVVVLLYYLVYVYTWKAGVYYGLFPVRYGVWGANAIFGLAGVVLLRRANRDKNIWASLAKIPSLLRLRETVSRVPGVLSGKLRPVSAPLEALEGEPTAKASFPRFARVMDAYILKEYAKILSLSVLAVITLFTVFTLFEVIDDIFTNRVPLLRVVEYFLFVWPMILAMALPLCVLISMLVCFGVMEKTNQTLILKASGVSVYRMVMPVVVLVVFLVPAVFALQEYILPYTNQRQDYLYNRMKGRKIKSFYQPDISWILGENGRIFNYDYFDPNRNTFANLSVYQVDLSEGKLVSVLQSRQAHWDETASKWVLTDGWERRFSEPGQRFSRFREKPVLIDEKPADFKTEIGRSDKMSYPELADYIQKLRQGGFDTLGLEVDLQKKISYPLVSLVMLLIGIPFSFMMGRRGALYGIVVSVLIGILFWATFNMFTTLGTYGYLPPVLASWAPNLFFGFAGSFLIFRMRT